MARVKSAVAGEGIPAEEEAASTPSAMNSHSLFKTKKSVIDIFCIVLILIQSSSAVGASLQLPGSLATGGNKESLMLTTALRRQLARRLHFSRFMIVIPLPWRMGTYWPRWRSSCLVVWLF
jgi:hypothetical protein